METSSSFNPIETVPDLPPLEMPDRDALGYLAVPPNITMRELEAKMPDFRIEIGGIFGQDERLKFLPKFGNDRSINWHQRELAAMKDADLTHSHPGGGALSESDLLLTAKHDARSLRAVSIVTKNKISVYDLRRPDDGWEVNTSDEDVVEYVARLMGRPAEDARESLPDIKAMDDYMLICRRARLMNAYYRAVGNAKLLIRGQLDLSKMSKFERAETLERYVHNQLSHSLREASFEYKKEGLDGN